MSTQISKAGEPLTSSEQDLRLLVEAIPTLVWRAAPEGNIDYVNKRVLEYLGSPLSEVIGWGWMDKVHPDDVAFKVGTWLQNLESGNPRDVVCRFRGGDGRYRWFEVRGEPLRASDGTVLSWCGVLIDADDRIRAEEALRESKSKRAEEQPRSAAQLQATLNVIPAYAWYAAASGGITFVNKRTADYLGVPEDHPLRFGIDIGAQWDAHIPFLHPDDQEGSRKAWSTCLRTGEASEFSFRVRNFQGGYRWFLSCAEPLRASDGTLLQWVGVNLDIEELKCAEQAFRESEYRLRQIIETVPGLVWSTGPDGEFTQVNQRFLEYNGLRFDDFLHGGWTKFVHPDDVPGTANAFSRALQIGTSYQAVHRLRRADGEYRWHHERGEPLRDGQGRIIQWYGLSVDIDERKKAEDRLRRSEAYLAEAQRLSHTGSFGWTPSTGELRWSDETFRILEYDSSVKPTIERVLQRVHPDDLARVRRVVDDTSRGDKVDVTHRLSMPDASIKFVHVVGHALKDAAGNPEIVGAVMDVTENTCLYRDLAEREAKIRRLVDANIVGIFIWDFEGRILEANDAFLRTIGYDRDDVAAGALRWTDLTPPDWRERDEQWVREHKASGLRSAIEKEYFRRDGSRVPVLVGAATFEEGGSQGVGFVIDLTERKRAEERLRVQHTVAQILAGAVTIEEATPRILRAMGECLRWDVGALWRVDLKAKALRCVELWHEASIEVSEFEGVSRASTFVPGLGLPGRVWSSLQPEYVPDVVCDENFPRGPIARREALHSALAFPILLGGEALGVIEFFSREIRQPDQELLNVLATIGSQIGQFIERTRAEEALRRSEAYLAEAQELSLTGSAAFNETTILYWSEETYRILGFDPREGLPDREAVADRTHPDDRERVREQARRAVQEKRDYTLEYRLLLPAGTIKHVELNAHPKFSTSGELLEIVGTLIDVTERKCAEEERKKAEERLRRSEAYLAEAQRLSHSGVAAYSKTTILWGSEETYQIWGFDPGRGVPSRDAINQRIHPDDRDRVLAEVRRAVGEGRDYSIAYRIVLPDGTAKHLESIGRPTFSASGELVEIVVTHLDVTERKRAEEALRESEQRFRDYAQAASDWYWETDPDHKFTRITDYERLLALGFTPVSRIGLTRWDYATDVESDPEKWEFHRSLLEARQPFRDFVYAAARSDGSLVFYKTSGKPIYDAKGAFLGYRGTGADVSATMRAEAALQESEYKLRQIIEAVPGLMWSTGPDGEPTYANQRFLDYTGTRLEDFKIRNKERFLHPEDLPDFVSAIDHAIQTGTPYEAVHRLRRSDGEYRWHHTRVEPLRDRQGQIIQRYGLTVDIDEAKKAEDQLRRSEAHLAEAQRLSRTGSSVYSETAILYWSEEAFRIWGFDPLQGLPSREAMLQRIHPDDRDRHHQETKDALREGRDCSIEFRIVLADGTVKDVEKIYHPVFSASGELEEIVASGIDVTERKRADQALRESQAKFRDFAESASDWFWEIGSDYKFTLLTENAFGSNAADRIGTACWDRALDLETEPEKWRILWATLEARKPFRDFVYCSTGGDGSEMYVKASGKPVFDANGEIRGYRGTGADVTATMRAQEEHERLRQLESDLAHMNRVSTMGELAASLAHEITQPIAAARNNARAALNFLEQQPPDMGEVREALGSVVGDADRAGVIVDRIRDHVRKAPPGRDRFNLNEAIHEVIVLARSAIAENGVSVHTLLTEGLVPIEGDRVQLQQVVLNLILNAAEAMSAVDGGGRVTC
jgi:PAS domain S-box-containing protein